MMIVDKNLSVVVKYAYDAWGNILSVKDANNNIITSADHLGNINPIRYRGYYYDIETGFYYLQSRYYDPAIRRFINADNQLTTDSDMTGMNLFTYCGNNPMNRIDPTGEAWWHWAIAAAVVVACAVAVVATAGGAAAGMAAVAAVGNGMAAATTASTIAAGAFIGSATVYGMAVATAASTSSSVKEFNDQGNWGTVAATAGGAVVGGAGAYTFTRGLSGSKTPKSSSKSAGKPFDPKGPKVQIGVDPNTLTINRSLLPDKMNAIRAEYMANSGIFRPVEVWRSGIIYDGNHRVAYAREIGAAVDVIIYP